MRSSKVLMSLLVILVSMSFVNCANQNKKVSGLKTINFDYDKSYIRSDMIPLMDKNVAAMKRHARSDSQYQKNGNGYHKNRGGYTGKVIVAGHCDERGSNEYNYALGHRRAEAAKSYMVTHGVDPKRVTTTSFGEDKPVCRQQSESCWYKNRRDDFSNEKK